MPRASSGDMLRGIFVGTQHGKSEGEKGMIEFILGRAGTGKTDTCLSAMAAHMKKEPMGSALVLLLPEHATYRAERRLAAMMAGEGEGFVRSIVFGFKRFARHVLQETGGAAAKRITKVGRRLLLKRILAEEAEHMQAFARAAKQRGFTETLEDAMEEMRSYGIDQDALLKAKSALGDEYLCQKLDDLALIYSRYRDKMAGRYNDTGDMLDALADKIPGARLLEGAEVWIDGFSFFNPQERKILKALFQKVEVVHITLAFDLENGARNQNEGSLFYRQAQTLQQLKLMAQELQISVRVHELKENQRFRSKGLAAIEQGAFSFPLMVQQEAAGIALVEAATRRLEMEAAAADIVRLCREKGLRWRDIAVLTRDEAVYGDMLALTLEDCGIPYFRDNKRAGVHHPLAELLRSAFEVLRGWRYDAVFRALKTGFFPQTRGETDLLENYVLEFGIRGSHWTMDEAWHWQRRRSLEEEEEATEKGKALLDKVDHYRRAAAEPLQGFALAVKAAATVRGYAEAAYQLLLELQVPQTLERWADEAERAGRLAEAREHRQIWDDVISLLEQMVETSGDEKIKVREFEDILGDGLDALQISLIPPGLDYVTVADFEQNSIENARAVYILGANEGIMPRRSHEKGLLSDADRLHLKEAGLELPQGSVEGSFNERFLLYKGFTEARDYLWISYALADTEGNALLPSSVIGQIRAVLPAVCLQTIPLESAQSRLFAGGRQAVTGLAAAFRVYREKKTIEPFWRDVYNWALGDEKMRAVLQKVRQGLFSHASEDLLPKEMAMALYAKKRRLRGSVTRFEAFRACPFQHFAHYGLRLAERSERSFRMPDLGILLHAVLREFGERLKSESKRWRDVDEAECSEILREILEMLAPRLQNEILLSTKQYRNLLSRIEETAKKTLVRLIELDRASEFRPVAFERSFGAGAGSLPPLTYALDDGCLLEITGQIDRIDMDETGRYFLVMDYKAGTAYINLIEVYYGLRLQLLTYLLVAKNLLAHTQEEEFLPAAMLYCFLKDPLVTTQHRIDEAEAKKLWQGKLKMPGWVLADADVIRALDSTFSFTKVALTKAGEIDKRRLEYVKSEKEFAILLDYIAYILADTGKQILSGEVRAQPYQLKGKTACSYCPYIAVCGFDPLVEGFSYRRLEDHEEAELMDSMELKGKEEVG